MTCEFCRSPRARWRYPAASRDWLACDKCHAAIQADDREALLGRVMLAPVPRTLPDRYAPRFRARARELHEEFWSARLGPAELVWRQEEFRDLGDQVLVLGNAFARGRESGVEVDQPGAWIAEVRGGQIVRFRSFSDQREALEAAGLPE